MIAGTYRAEAAVFVEIFYFYGYLKGLIICKFFSITCSCCISSVYNNVHLFCNAEATINESQYENPYFSFTFRHNCISE